MSDITLSADYVRIQDALAEEERWLGVIYVVGALCFSIAIFNFRKPSTSQVGNLFAMIGMLASLGGTLGSTFVNGFGYWIAPGIFFGVGAIGVYMAVSVKMTSMPVFVGFLNAMGGLAAALESLALYVSPLDEAQQKMEWALPWGRGGMRFQIYNTIFYLLGMIIGTITFTGSIVACMKLQGKFKFETPKGKKFYKTLLVRRKIFSFILLVAFLATAVVAGVLGLGVDPIGLTLFAVSMVMSGIYGIYFVLCIGGADMPVVISLLNSASGWSTVFAGLAFGNELMMIAGAFVGASGLILSVMMCQAMNRSLKNVLVGGFGGDGSTGADGAHLEAYITDLEKAAKVIAGAKLVYVVPGYGMAAGQAQKQVAELGEIINAQTDRECRFAVHPVAGRLPGHMNVLLAEANVPYNFVDDITANKRMEGTDVVLIVGANDIYNPAAKYDKSSNIYGMEVLNVWEAKRTIVVKRSMRTGYAGIDNSMFYYPQTSMLLGDAKEAVGELCAAVRAEFAKNDIDGVEGFINADDRRISGRIEQEKRLKAMQSNDKKEEEEEPQILCTTINPITLGVLREPAHKNDLRMPLHYRDIASKVLEPMGIQKIMFEQGGEEESLIRTTEAVLASREEILNHADIFVTVSFPDKEELDIIAQRTMSHLNDVADIECKAQLLIEGQNEFRAFHGRTPKPIVLSLFGNPSGTRDIQDHASALGITLLSMDIIPRVTAAQCMDVLSSSAKVAGFRSVIEVCQHYGRLIGAEITAAGTYPPAKCLVVGCGVAGLAAIGDMHRLGAEVRAFDVRPQDCADQVKSMGGKFLMMDFGDEAGGNDGGYANIMSDSFVQKELELFAQQAKECDLYILTAAIPGRAAPKLILDYHVDAMKPGSVIVDLAAATGGNCTLTRPGENYVTDNGVKIIGKVDFIKTVAAPISSEMLSANVVNWFDYNCKKAGALNCLDVRDPIIRAVCLTHQGVQMWPCPRPPPPQPKVVVKEEATEVEVVKVNRLSKRNPKFFNATPGDIFLILFLFGFFALLAWSAPVSLNSKLMILVLACWTGYLLVRGVTVALHTPLMSLTNAISGVVIVAAMLSISPMLAGSTEYGIDLCSSIASEEIWYCQKRSTATIVIDSLALAAASMNVVGGFAVTQRMLQMFKARA